MRLVKFLADEKIRAGVLEGEDVIELEFEDMAGVLEMYLDQPARLSAHRGRGWRRAEVVFFPPVGRCARIFAIAQNYPDHAAESGGPQPPAPVIFLKPDSALVSPDSEVELPGISTAFDYEGELGVLIGRTASSVSQVTALNYVAGYTICNDGTARDLVHTMLGGRPIPDWFSGKAINGTAPVGPHVITADGIRDPQQLAVETRLNGVVVQSDSTASMTFSIAEQIEYISSRVKLQPGDLLMSGTPGGVGKARGRYLQAGDVVEVEISRIGVLRTRYVATGGQTTPGSRPDHRRLPADGHDPARRAQS